MSVIEENKDLARRFLELVEEHDVEAICALIAPAWRMVGGPPDLAPGPEGMRALFAGFGPIEQRWTVEDVIAEGDKVVVRAVNTCVQDSFFGIPAGGRTQTFTATFIHRIADGKIQETWRNADDLGRLFQLGARLVPGTPDP
jgi:ketosteroid isomerase-like protein